MILQIAQRVILDVNGTLKNVLIIFLANNLAILYVLIPGVNSKISVNGIHRIITIDIVYQNELLLYIVMKM